MQPKRSAMLMDEEPPISFYADLIEDGTVKVDYNEEGGLMVTQATQSDPKMFKKKPWLLPLIINLFLVLCVLLTTYTIHKIAFDPIPCSCLNCGNCVSLGVHLMHSLRRLWGK